MLSLEMDVPYYAEKYVHAMIDILGLDRYDADLTISFYEYLGPHMLGYCDGEMDWVHVGVDKRIRSKREKLKTLAHEMIHVHQLLSGDLILSANSGVHKWKTRKYRQSDDCPWEIEAEALEDALYKKAQMRVKEF